MHFSKGEYAAFNSLIYLSILLIKGASNKDRSTFLLLVSIYIGAIFLQGFAIGLFYFGVKHYIGEGGLGYIKKIFSYISIDLTSVEQLVISLAPAILLLILSSKVLSISRVGLSRLVLRLRESLIIKYKSSPNIILSEGDDTFYRNMDGTFGAIRALFLNAFVFAQALVSILVLFYFEPYLAIFNIFCLLSFMFILTKVKVKKSNGDANEKMISQKDALDAAAEAVAEIEGVGISSKSFERLERMRIYGRNATNVVLFCSIIVGVSASLDFLTSLDKLTLILFLLRYISNVYTPIAVISASCVPFKSNLVTLINIENYLNFYKYKTNFSNVGLVSTRGLFFISKSFGDRQLFIDEALRPSIVEKYKLSLELSEIRVETANFSKDYPRERKKISNFIRYHLKSTDNIYFLV
ncbi:hypothetical protein [Marinomonas primoryensis]|uniref:Putative transmembrane protein n=1 Tax=Marinomonas primoryensis TaxID=178399 RepID=A0A859CZK9_9GAMM|nr:hypothetical protein [Marinomonas primoryensis]QKK81964.1 putative transmembrane protein [Marinomonas primoryensis]